MKKILLPAIALVLIVSIWLGRVYLSKHYFPLLSEGFYSGYVLGLDLEDPAQKNRLVMRVVHNATGDVELHFNIQNSKWVNRTVIQPGARGGKQLDAIVQVDGNEQLLLWGAAAGDSNKFSGDWKLTPGNQTGTWELESVDLQADQIGPGKASELQHLALLRAELDTVERQLELSRQELSANLEQVNKLTEFVTNPESLRTQSDQRFEAAEIKERQLKEQLTKLSAEVGKMQQQVNLAYKVTQRGRLVSLARESLEREGRWVESMFRSQVGSGSADLTPILERANQIAELRQQINAERNLLFQLRVAEEYAR